MSDEIDVEVIAADADAVETVEAAEIVVADAEAQESADAATESDADADGVDADDADETEPDAEGAEAAPAASGRSRREEAMANEGEIAADYIEGLLDIADLDGDIDTYNEGGRAHVSIITESNVLVGKSGEVLDALQELARLAVMTETGHRSRLMLDVAGHREKRRTELQGLASEAVAEVGATGEAVRLTPMNPFERKIVHDVIAAAGLVSESEGEEPNRRVVVMPKA